MPVTEIKQEQPFSEKASKKTEESSNHPKKLQTSIQSSRGEANNESSLDHLFRTTNTTPRLLSNYLHPNAKYVGEQNSLMAKYHIKVEFKTVDLLNSLVTGFLTISGLTIDHPEITTSFRGEIINNPLNNTSIPLIKRYSFITENKSWESYPENDMEHWAKLSRSVDLEEEQFSDKLSNIQRGNEGHGLVYMRWKEEFLIPDSRIKQIVGASFEGFYYIVLNIGGFNNDVSPSTLPPGTISGLYYHKKLEKFQALSLSYEEDRDGSKVFEFQ